MAWQRPSRMKGDAGDATGWTTGSLSQKGVWEKKTKRNILKELRPASYGRDTSPVKMYSG